jgi:hypothetical protein
MPFRPPSIVLPHESHLMPYLNFRNRFSIFTACLINADNSAFILANALNVESDRTT